MTIIHRSVIWVTQLGASRAFEVLTARGFAAEYGVDPDKIVASNIKDGKPLAYTLEIAMGYDAALEIQKCKGQQVSFGDLIEIEGDKYKVQHSSGGYSFNEVELALES